MLSEITPDEIDANCNIWNTKIHNEETLSEKVKNVFDKLHQQNSYLADILLNNLNAIQEQSSLEAFKIAAIAFGFLLDIIQRHIELKALESFTE
jgi:hemerythrin-like domain-containing protein